MTILTKNTDKLREEVAAHVAADSIIQGIYWDAENERGGFIGCLGRSQDPTINEVTYGLPVMVQRIAESIFESLPANEAKAFFAALPDAVGCDGKDLTRVGWQFLAAELRCLPAQSAEIQAVIDPVIAGMDLLASGQEWAAAAAAADAADAAADAAGAAAWAAADAAWAAARAADAARAATATAADAAAAARLRQRDLLLRLIIEAPVVENATDIKTYKLDAAFAELRGFDRFAKPHDFAEVSLWRNGEGFDAHLSTQNGQTIRLSWGEFKALKKLVKELDK